MSLKLIVIYAAYGDTLLLQTPDQPPKYWLIDGGPVTPSPIITHPENRILLNAYYQYLKRALYRYCSSQKNDIIDKLSGIIVTHPDVDHMDGINRLLRRDMIIPANFKGPVVLNSTFYRTDDPPLFKYPLTQFLADNRFGLSAVFDPLSRPPPPPDPQIPTNMKNGSLADVYKMVNGDPINPYPQPGDWDPQRHDLDESTQNWSSIITLWLDPGTGGQAELNLVTTGDGLPSYILQRMDLVSPGKAPTMGIFKVPHHGSEYNNQWADDPDDYVGSGDITNERNFFFFLTMLALHYGDRNAQQPTPMDNFKTEVLGGSPMLDWTTLNSATPGDFEVAIQQLSDSLCTYMELSTRNAKVGNATFTLPTQLRDFADALVARYDDRKAQIIDTGRVEDGTPGASKVTVPNFKKDTFKTTFLNSIQAVNQGDPKYFETLFSCLDSNALSDLHKARLVQNFYSKFTAYNYVISGNRFPHFHPKPSVLAGLMAHLILTVPGTTNPRRIFVTDGASVPLDYVYDLLMGLLSRSPNPLLPGQWQQKVRVYYLATDFLAEIPLDLSHVDGVEMIDFSRYARPDDEEYFTFLHKQFMAAKPYDMPRAAISHTSLFRITISSAANPGQKYLDMNAAGQLLLAQGGQPLFNLRYMDYNAANRNKWTYKDEPHFELLRAQLQGIPIPDLVFIRLDPARTDSNVYKESAVGQQQELHLDNNGVITFQTGGGNTQAVVQFERNTIP